MILPPLWGSVSALSFEKRGFRMRSKRSGDEPRDSELTTWLMISGSSPMTEK